MMPSQTGIDYMLPIFTDAIGNEDMEVVRTELFAPGSLTHAYHSINTDVHKRIRYID
jgi:6-phosphofructokinase 1